MGRYADIWIATLRQLLRALLALRSWRLPLALTTIALTSLTEGIGLLLLVPLLGLVGLDVQHGALGPLVQFLSSILTRVSLQPTLTIVLAVYVFLMMAHGLLTRWQVMLIQGLEEEFVSSLRRDLYTAITNARWVVFARSRSSDFIHLLANEVDRAGAAAGQLINIGASVVPTAAYVVMAFILSPAATLFASACAIGLLLTVRRKTQCAHAAGERFSQAMSGLYRAITEHLGNLKLARSYGAEEPHTREFEVLTCAVTHTHLEATRDQADLKAWLDSGSVLLLGLTVYVSFTVVRLATSEVLLLLYIFARVTPRLFGLRQNVQLCATFVPAFAAVAQMQTRYSAEAEPRPSQTETVEFKRAIVFKGVSFAYLQRPVICDLDLTIRAGKTTAIIGPSGVGKTTIADLALGLLVPDRGQVLVDDVPLGPERMEAWRERVGYVPQDTFLFHDTVRANLQWARPQANEKEIAEALRLAAAEEFVAALPHGLDSVVGDRGVLLSGGERQRLALARALLRKPSLLILDEASSSLDIENERKIQRAVEALRGRMAILIITHRLSAIRAADVIYVLEQGRVVETGNWNTLATAEDGRFHVLQQGQSISA